MEIGNLVPKFHEMAITTVGSGGIPNMPYFLIQARRAIKEYGILGAAPEPTVIKRRRLDPQSTRDFIQFVITHHCHDVAYGCSQVRISNGAKIPLPAIRMTGWINFD